MRNSYIIDHNIISSLGFDSKSNFKKLAQKIKRQVKFIVLLNGKATPRIRKELEKINYPKKQIMKRALISVFDKTNVVEFAKELTQLGWEIISTGGTSAKFKAEGIPVMDISDLTQFPECFDGRVKTLHPNVEGGILAIRDNETHQNQMKELGIDPIDIVVCNLYPFKQTVLNPDAGHEEIIENIDIGGPTMVRAAAKNFPSCAVVCDPSDYEDILKQVGEDGCTTWEQRLTVYISQKVLIACWWTWSHYQM